MANSLHISGFMYKFIHHSFIEWLLCARQNSRGWDKEIEGKKKFKDKEKN